MRHRYIRKEKGKIPEMTGVSMKILPAGNCLQDYS